MSSSISARKPSDQGLIGTSDVMQSLHVDIELAAGSTAKVLLTGETGVGKDVVANAIHQRSARRDRPFVTINCAGVPDTLLESRFFGHTKGSFTGAMQDQPGLFRQAHHGTVFLDEVGEMSVRMQGLLLRFLETGELQTVGGTATRAVVDTRVITATNRDLLEEVSANRFREDLYYRLNVLHMWIPPLRQRKPDVALLLDHYGRVFAQQYGRPVPVLSQGALDVLAAYAWPGNIRELRNIVERIVVQSRGAVVEPEHLPVHVVGRAREAQAQAQSAVEHLPGSHEARAEALVERLLLQKESFWSAVHARFIAHDITRADVRFVVGAGLQRTRGSYRLLLSLFNMAPDDYKRFLGFLKQHECHVPFQGFRAKPLAAAPIRRRATDISA